MIIETDRLYIRPMTMEDASDLFKVLSNEKVMAFIEPPFTLNETEAFIKKYGMCDCPMVYSAQLKDGEVIGHIIYHTYDSLDCYELGWIIGEDYWHKGFANEITSALIEYSKGNNLTSLILECDKGQSVSKHIALLHGFKHCGFNDNLEIYKLNLKDYNNGIK
ncbi:MAG: GNAT family N-acetyltransferase [Oscillospiraceae bacterium]